MAAAVALASPPCADASGAEFAVSCCFVSSARHGAGLVSDGNGGRQSGKSERSSLATVKAETDFGEVVRALNVTSSDNDSGASRDTFDATGSFSSQDSDGASQQLSQRVSQRPSLGSAAATNSCDAVYGTAAIAQAHESHPRVDLRDSFDSAEPRADAADGDRCVCRSSNDEHCGAMQPAPLFADASSTRDNGSCARSSEGVTEATANACLPFNWTHASEAAVLNDQDCEPLAPVEAGSLSCTGLLGEETGWESVRRALEERAAAERSNRRLSLDHQANRRRSLEHHAIGSVDVREVVAESAALRAEREVSGARDVGDVCEVREVREVVAEGTGVRRTTSNYGAAEILERMQAEGEELVDESLWEQRSSDGLVRHEDRHGNGGGGDGGGVSAVFPWLARESARRISFRRSDARLDSVAENPRTPRRNGTNNSTSSGNDTSPPSPQQQQRQGQRDSCCLPCGGIPGAAARVRPRWQMDPAQLVIRDFVARGSFGSVHRGLYKGRDVAVKLLNWAGESGHGGGVGGVAGAAVVGAAGEGGRGKNGGAGKPEAAGKIDSADLAFLRDVFAQEVLVWSKLRHKNICEFVGAIIGGNEAYDLASTVEDHQGQLRVGRDFCCVVLEFLPGGTLKQLLAKHSRKKKRLPLKRALQLALQVAQGLHYLHARNIVHRDLKTDNLLLDQKQRVVKIADFGVSRVEPGDKTMKRRTGTYGYMAPEVLREQPYDHTADVYSYGIVLWEIVTCGNPFPFEGLKPEQVCSMVNQGLRPDVPSWCEAPLAALMRCCWHHTAASRPDMGEVVERLRGLTLQCATALPACACM